MRRVPVWSSLALPVLLTAVYIVADLVVDHQKNGQGYYAWPHLLVGSTVVLVASAFIIRIAGTNQRAEKVTREARDQLEARVRERTAELERANQRLQEEIAERERAKLALRDSEETAKALMNASSESAVLTDTRGTVLAVNDAATQSLGLCAEEMVGRSLFDCFSPEVAQTRRPYLERAVATGLPGHYVDERDGRSFEIHVEPIRNTSGEIIRIAAFGLDITERKRADTATRASEAKYRLLFQNMSEGFALYELVRDGNGTPVDWQVLEVNNAYSRHTGIDASQIVGRRISELFPEAVAEYLPRFAGVVASQKTAASETFAAIVGRHQRVSTFPAGGDRFASIIEDISERKRAEQELRDSEERFEKVFRYSPDAIALLSADTGVVLDINLAFSMLLGHHRADCIGARWDQLDLVSEVDGAKLAEMLAASGQVADQEVALRTKAGGIATMLVSLIPTAVGDQAYVMVIGHDISARIRSEEALRRTQAELAHGIEVRAALEERQRLARELHDSVSQALYGVSLGINTALTLLDQDRARTLEALEYSLSLTRAGLAEMRALIFELRPDSLESEGLVVALTRQVDALRARYGLNVTLSLDEEPALPLSAREALYRIAVEALHNVVKHAKAARLDVRLVSDAQGLLLEICDDGQGFDQGADFPGHFGLRFMRERAQALGCDLVITSAPGCGTQIRVTLQPASLSPFPER